MTIVKGTIEGLLAAAFAVLLFNPQQALANCGHTYDVNADCEDNGCCDLGACMWNPDLPGYGGTPWSVR
jgi:hypothetical protein